jgi:hypothetical protein
MLHAVFFLLLPAVFAAASDARASLAPPVAALSASRPPVQETEEQEQALEVTVVEIRGRLLRGPKEAGAGTLSVDEELVRWDNQRKAKRSFSVQARIIREATLVCARRAGSDVCLELELKTVTGEKHRFRDVRWAAGDSQEIRRLYQFLQDRHPRIVFGERRVKRIR